jgi:mannose-6-phosphate isomerase-like protein (cupin superfamily)
MDERNVELFARVLANPSVTADHHHLVSGLQELVRPGRELLPPLLVERVEDVRPDLVETVVETAVRQALRLVPLDLGVHVAEHGVHVAPLERVVGALDDLDDVHPHNLERVRFAMHETDSGDGRLFDGELFTQRVVPLAGGRDAGAADEVLYVLEGSGQASIGGETHPLQPGTSVFIARGTAWDAEGDGRAVSVLVHKPAAASTTHAVIDLTAAEKGSATAGREFVLGATPAVGCRSVTQFIGLVPPGRAPDHFHPYDEVIYILEGEGELHIGGEQAELGPGSCVHLPARLVHCLANTGDTELRLLGVFRPAGSPAEAYYPDGTLAVSPKEEVS